MRDKTKYILVWIGAFGLTVFGITQIIIGIQETQPFTTSYLDFEHAIYVIMGVLTLAAGVSCCMVGFFAGPILDNSTGKENKK